MSASKLMAKILSHPTCILSSFSQNASQILLPKRLSKCASTISFRKYKQKVALLVIYLFNYALLMQLSSCRISHLTLTSIRLLSDKQIGILRFLQHIFLLRRKKKESLARISFFLISLYVLICTF